MKRPRSTPRVMCEDLSIAFPRSSCIAAYVVMEVPQ